MPAFRWSFEVYNLSALGFSCCTMAMQGNHSAGKSQILLKFCREFPMHGVNKLSLCSLPSQLFPHFQSRTRRINQPTDHGPAKMLINSEWGHCPPLPAPPCILIRPCKLTGAKHKHCHFLFHVCFSVLHFFLFFIICYLCDLIEMLHLLTSFSLNHKETQFLALLFVCPLFIYYHAWSIVSIQPFWKDLKCSTWSCSLQYHNSRMVHSEDLSVLQYGTIMGRYLSS